MICYWARPKKVTERPTGEFEVSRLSKILGEKFMLKAKALTMSELEAFPKGEKFKIHVIVTGISEPNLKDKELRDKYTPAGRKNPLTPVELVETLFFAGRSIEPLQRHNGVVRVWR